MLEYHGNNLTPLVRPEMDAGIPVKLYRKAVSITELLQQPPKAIEDHGEVLRWYNPEMDRMSVRSYLIKLAEDFQDMEPPYEHERIIPIAPGYEVYRWEGQVQIIKQAKYSEILKIKPNLRVPPSQRLRRGGPRILYQLPPRQLEDRLHVIHLPPVEKDQFFSPPHASPVTLAPPRRLKRPRVKVPPSRSLSKTQSVNGYIYPLLTPPPSPDTTSHAQEPVAGPSRTEAKSAANAQRKTIPLRRPLARIPIQAPLPRRAPLVGAQPLLNSDALGVPSPLDAFPGPAEDEYEDGTPVEQDIEMDGSHLVPMRSEEVPMKITYPPLPRGCITPPPSTSPSPQLKRYHKEYPPRAFSPGPSWLHKQKQTVEISREDLRRDLSDAQKELAEMLYEVAVAEEELKKAGKETKELVDTLKDGIGPGFDFDRILEQARKAAKGDANANYGTIDDHQRNSGLKVHVARTVKKLPRTKPILQPATTGLFGSPLQQILPAVRGTGNVAPVHVGMVRTNLRPAARRQREAEEAQVRAALQHAPLTSPPTPVSPSEQPSPSTATAPSSPIQTAFIGSGPGSSTTVSASYPSVDDDSDDELEYVDELVRNPSEPRSNPAKGEGPADHQEHTEDSDPSRTVETSSPRQEINDADALEPGPSQPTFTPLASSSQYTRTGNWDAAYGGDTENETWLLPNSNFDNDFHVHTLDHWKWGRPVPKDDPAAKGAGPDQRAVYLPPPGYSEMIHSSRYRGQKRKREEPESSDDDRIPADILTKKRAKICMEDWHGGWSLEDTDRIAQKALPTSESEAIFTNLSSGFSSSDSSDSDSEMGDNSDGGHSRNTFQPPAATVTPFVRLQLEDNSSDADSEYQADVEMSDSEPASADDDEEPYIPSMNDPPNEQSVLQSFFDRTDEEVDARSAWLQPPPQAYTLQPSLLVPPPAPAPGPSRGLRRANEMILPDRNGQPGIWKWDQGPEFEQRMKRFEASLPKREPQIRPAPHPLHMNHDDYIAEFEGIHWDARDAGWSRELILMDAEEEEDEEIEEIEESEFLGKAKGTS